MSKSKPSRKSTEPAALRRFAKGNGYDAASVLGAHPAPTGAGFRFCLWAPNAREVWLEGDFDGWRGRAMQREGAVWSLEVAEATPGQLYKFAVLGADGVWRKKADPFAAASELRPGDASRLFVSSHRWRDAAWMRERAARQTPAAPISIYELHAGSWMRAEDGEFLGWRALAEPLLDHARALGFTHVELLPPLEHPYDPSWGYQVTGYFAPTARFGDPDDFRAFVDTLHRGGVGVLIDWVPAHFPRDEHGLQRFDGTALFEYADPRLGAHPDWGTLVFDYARPEVRSFLLASACHWAREFHIDGLRFDAVASMLYLDYSRPEGGWLPNRDGGNWNYDAISLLQDVNRTLASRHPGVLRIAEESTAFAKVTGPPPPAFCPPDAGLGFDLKWNMGWMHDTLGYLRRAPEHRRWHHHEMTFASTYAFAERFVLPLSHDEVVHGKGALICKMAGPWQDGAAQLRALLCWQWTSPGKKLLFMGGELGDDREWNVDVALRWAELDTPVGRGIRNLVAALNDAYRTLPALHLGDAVDGGLQWIDADDADRSVYSFLRRDPAEAVPPVLVVASFSDLRHEQVPVRVPGVGAWRPLLCSAEQRFGGAVQIDGAPLQPIDVGGANALLLDVPPYACWLLTPLAWEPTP